MHSTTTAKTNSEKDKFGGGGGEETDARGSAAMSTAIAEAKVIKSPWAPARFTPPRCHAFSQSLTQQSQRSAVRKKKEKKEKKKKKKKKKGG